MDLLNGLLDLTQLILQLTLLEAHIIQLFDNLLLGISNFPKSIIDTVLILLNLLDLHGLRVDDGFPVSDLLMQLGDDVLCPLHLTVYRFFQAPLFLVLHQVIADNIAPLHLFKPLDFLDVSHKGLNHLLRAFNDQLKVADLLLSVLQQSHLLFVTRNVAVDLLYVIIRLDLEVLELLACFRKVYF